MAAPMRNALKFIDIGANLTDPVFRGVYHGSRKHEDDLVDVLNRAKDHGVEKIIVTAGNLQEAKSAIEMCKTDGSLYTTVGVHPTRCLDFEKSGDPQQYLGDMKSLIVNNTDRVVALGELGLDYDRLHFCDKQNQLKYFEKQMSLAAETGLPLFLHSRNAHNDFMDIICRHRDKIKAGVVHSFTGSKDEVKSIVDQGLYIGINGCSLKTQENIDAMCSIPTEKLMLETDAPWCEIKPTHAGHKNIKTTFASKKKEKWERGMCVKGRSEPAYIMQVLEVIAAARNEDIASLAHTIYENTEKLFFHSNVK